MMCGVVAPPSVGSMGEAGKPLGQSANLSGRSARVWIVDDSPGQRELASRALQGHDLTLFADGPAMLERLAFDAPDVLVLDFQMPHLSGIDVCRYVRSRKDAATLPILMLTALGTSETLLEALAAGANDYVEIPFRSLELRARISGLVQLAALRARVASVEAQLRLEADFRERFIGMLAHDLRQPVSAISMANHFLSRAEAPWAGSAQLLAIQHRESERLKRMLSELLEFTRNRPASGLPLQRKWTDWADVLRETLDPIRANHPDHRIELSVEGACVGYWDRDRLSQLCANLIGNAMDHGSPTEPVLLELQGRAEYVELRVSNLGGRLRREALLTFIRPQRRALQKCHSESAAGLGLYIVNQITRAHQGTIDVQNREEWTEFVVQLPRGGPEVT